MADTKTDTGIKSPPLSLDDDDDQAAAPVPTSSLLAGLKKTGNAGQGAKLDQGAKDALRQQAETSPLVTTRSHRPAPPPKPAAPPPEKVVRDGYSIPRTDHEALERLADVVMRAGSNIGKSGIIRLGVRLLADMDEAKLVKLAAALPPVPTAKRKR